MSQNLSEQQQRIRRRNEAMMIKYRQTGQQKVRRADEAVAARMRTKEENEIVPRVRRINSASSAPHNVTRSASAAQHVARGSAPRLEPDLDLESQLQQRAVAVDSSLAQLAKFTLVRAGVPEVIIDALQKVTVSCHDEDCCPICLEDFVPDGVRTLMPCDHVFHVHCLKQWLLNHVRCPMCNLEIV